MLKPQEAKVARIQGTDNREVLDCWRSVENVQEDEGVGKLAEISRECYGKFEFKFDQCSGSVA